MMNTSTRKCFSVAFERLHLYSRVQQHENKYYWKVVVSSFSSNGHTMQ